MTGCSVVFVIFIIIIILVLFVREKLHLREHRRRYLRKSIKESVGQDIITEEPAKKIISIANKKSFKQRSSNEQTWYQKGCECLGILPGDYLHVYSDSIFGDQLHRTKVLKALICFNFTLVLNPDFQAALVNKAACLYYLGRVEEAVECAEAAMRPYSVASHKLLREIKEAL